MDAVLDVQKNRYIGVDVGGTRLKLGVVSGRGAVSEVENIPTPPTRDELYDVIASFATSHAEAGPLGGHWDEHAWHHRFLPCARLRAHAGAPSGGMSQ